MDRDTRRDDGASPTLDAPSPSPGKIGRSGDAQPRSSAVSVAGALAAVDVKDFAGHKACRFEIENRPDDVRESRPYARPGGGPQWLASSVSTGFISVLMMPGETAFTRMRRLASSMASDRVAGGGPPFVSDASAEGT